MSWVGGDVRRVDGGSHRVDGDPSRAGTVVEAAEAAVRAVPDPEYPGVGIGELGLVVDVRADEAGTVHVDLVPTFLGCPALDLIARDVVAAVSAVEGVHDVELRWRRDVVWTPDRITDAGREHLGELTVAVRHKSGDVRCPVCGSGAVLTVSEFGPSPCRTIARCASCRNPVEVIRS